MAYSYWRGRAGYEVWAVYESLGSGSYEAERIVDGQREVRHVRAHCLTCAKSEVLARYGGRVDLRGWHMAAPTCGAWLKSMQRTVDEEAEVEEGCCPKCGSPYLPMTKDVCAHCDIQGRAAEEAEDEEATV